MKVQPMNSEHILIIAELRRDIEAANAREVKLRERLERLTPSDETVTVQESTFAELFTRALCNFALAGIGAMSIIAIVKLLTT